MAIDLEKAFKAVLWYEIEGKLHTSIPGIVSKYDSKDVKAEVRPIINKLYIDGQSLPYEPIVSVPVVFPRTKRFHLSFPLEIGDGVMLIFSEKSLEAYLKAGKEYAEPRDPEDIAIFALTDGMAIPGLFAFGQGSKIGDPKKMEMVFDKVSFKSDGKNFTITNGSAIVETNNGQVKINSDGLTVD